MSSPGSPTRTGSLDPLRQRGRWLVDPAGRVVTVHGFNVVAKVPPYTPRSFGFGRDDAAFLAAHGFNAVRLGFLRKALEPVPGHHNDHYLGAIASAVATLAAHGSYTLLDFHEDFYHERFAAMWRHVAARFAGEAVRIAELGMTHAANGPARQRPSARLLCR